MATTYLDIPFNQPAGSTTAPGTGGPAQIVQGSFVPGRKDNAVYFSGNGYADIPGANPIQLDQDFTFSFWAKAEVFVDSPTDSWVLFKFPGAENYVYLSLKTSLTSWTYVTVKKTSAWVKAFINSQEVDSEDIPAGWGVPTGFCILTDNPYDGAGHATIQDVQAVSGVDGEIIVEPAPMANTQYFVNGVNFLNYFVYVSKSNGILDNLAMKEPLTVEWDDYHGEVIDLTAPRYEPRDIVLSCFIVGVGKDEFIDRVQAFINAFQRPNTQRLLIKAHSTKPIPYEVYMRESLAIDKKFNSGLNVGTFELRLREPSPVKRVLFATSGTVNVSFSSNKQVDIFWGDGTKSVGLSGSVSTSHTYSGTGEYYIIIAGVIEDITGFSSNATVVWSKLS